MPDTILLGIIHGLIIGAMFGVWQHNFMAGLFAYNVIFFVALMVHK